MGQGLPAWSCEPELGSGTAAPSKTLTYCPTQPRYVRKLPNESASDAGTAWQEFPKEVSHSTHHH